MSHSKTPRWLREPLVQFLLAGGVVFGAYSLLTPDLPQNSQQNRIEITVADLEQMNLVWRAKRHRPASPEELVAMVNSKIKEEILYREAIALGLEQDDTIIKRRLAQKMEFLSEDVSGISDPTLEEMKEWYDTHAERFALSGRISFHHLYFSPDRRGDAARADALAAFETLIAQGDLDADQIDPAIADPFMYRDFYADRDPTQIAQDFGAMFTTALFPLDAGGWQGPIESGLGWHLVKITSKESGSVPPFEMVAGQVKAEMIAERRDITKAKAFEKMRERYEIILPVAPRQDAGSEDTSKASGVAKDGSDL